MNLSLWTSLIGVVSGGSIAQLIHVWRAARNDVDVREQQRDRASVALGDTLGGLVTRLDQRVRSAEERERRAVLRAADLFHWVALAQLAAGREGVRLPPLPATIREDWPTTEES
jgi:hypothetical protein